MAEMTRSAAISLDRSEFDEFLFAPIGEDRNGMLLSVLSALARLDVDPWQEAAKLARLPGRTAVERLTALIAALPDGPSTHLDSGTIAARLIALLPRRSVTAIPWRAKLPGAGAVTKSPAATSAIICFIVMAVMLGTQCVIASQHAPVENAQAPLSGTAFSQKPPPSSGR
jgi:hypothetical protein